MRRMRKKTTKRAVKRAVVTDDGSAGVALDMQMELRATNVALQSAKQLVVERNQQIKELCGVIDGAIEAIQGCTQVAPIIRTALAEHLGVKKNNALRGRAASNDLVEFMASEGDIYALAAKAAGVPLFNRERA